MAPPGEPTFFASQKAFLAWLRKNHASSPGLLVGLVRKEGIAAGIAGIPYQEALDAALCWGWIDGVRYGIDARVWTIRFSPRKPRSIWSAVNIRRVEELIAAGRMEPPGLAAFSARTEDRSRIYSHERNDIALSPEQEDAFKANAAAWTWWSTQAPSYRKVVSWWVVSAKRPETRASRLATLIADSAAGRKVRAMTPPAELRRQRERP